MRKEKDYRLVKAHGAKDACTFKKFSHKKDIVWDLHYNVYCGDVVEMIDILPTKQYTLLIVDIP